VVAGKQNAWVRMMENDPNRQTGIFNFVKNQQGQVQMVPEKK